jgi:hypothetical protein
VDTSSGLNEQLADAARALQAEMSTQRTLERRVALATELIDGCDYAGISFVRRKGPIETPAATDPLVLRGDELQYSLQGGSMWRPKIGCVAQSISSTEPYP